MIVETTLTRRAAASPALITTQILDHIILTVGIMAATTMGAMESGIHGGHITHMPHIAALKHVYLCVLMVTL